MSDSFSENLSFLCSHYASIAEVCRRININRQQFNKYLSGESRPSRASMRKICDFFGLTEAEILFESTQLRSLIAVRNQLSIPATTENLYWNWEKLYERSDSLSRYTGYYFRYFYSFGNQGKIFRTLGLLYEKDSRFFWKNIELVRNPNSPGRRTKVIKYEGAAFLLNNRIYIVEIESIQQYSITQMMLFPSYENRVDRLIGIHTGGPFKRGRKPGASKLLLEYLGASIDVKKHLYLCGLYEPDDKNLPEGVPELIANNIEAGSFVLEVSELE